MNLAVHQTAAPTDRRRSAGRAACLIILLAIVLAPAALSQVSDRVPAQADPAAHTYSALGAVAERKVEVEWNRFYDHAGLGAILEKIHRAFPDLTRLYSIGRS